LLQRSRLDDVYSLSSKLTCKKMWDSMPGSATANCKLVLELNKYVDPFTGKADSRYILNRTKCPLCDSNDYEFLFLKHGFDHALCNSCNLIFTLQILDNTKLSHLEQGGEGDQYGEYKENTQVNEMDRKKFEIVFDSLSKHTTIKKIFDFGSQSGTFLDWISEKYTGVGHEYHTPLRELALKKGHNVLNDNLESIELEGEFDVITCWDYIDHVLEPRKVIKNLSKYLKKGGLFFFAINNRDCLSVRMMHENSPVFIGPHHTMHYGIEQLKRLMPDYELLESESYVSELNWISNWLNFQNPELGDSKLMFELFDPKKICELGMGIKLNAIFKKL
jgi:2-polyprenyl-3-methyl-5-hydroxy-6-metoxy-1,4-benzoquinol methylase